MVNSMLSRAPEGLVEAIGTGSCVAFVGAGFSKVGGLPSWNELLLLVSEDARADVREYVRDRISKNTPSSHDLDEAAQVLEVAMGNRFIESMLRSMQAQRTDRLQKRVQALESIPFRAILTTNFDDVLEGSTPSSEAYSAILRPTWRSEWTSVLSEKGLAQRVLKLHGDLRKPDTVVFTRRGYRERLYRDPGYREFLRVIFSQFTVLFIGASFTDAYLSELRSECLALFEHQNRISRTVAYALLPDPSPIKVRYLRDSEGIQVIPYSSENEHEGFDRFLVELSRSVGPEERLTRLLKGKRILWVDPQPRNNQAYASYFSEIASTTVDLAKDADEAMSHLATKDRSVDFDLVITHWGRENDPTAIRLLERMRESRVEVPAIVFSTYCQDWAQTRKLKAMRLGAQGYYFSTDGLIGGIERTFDEERELP